MAGGELDMVALREWDYFVLPLDREKWPALMAQLLSDLAAAVERIDELEGES